MIGHVPARTYLEANLPTATLLYGPPSIGKWTLAVHLADHYRIHALDRWFVEHGLSVETSRLITHFAARAPQSTFKFVVARLDDASKPALNALLKTLEEPPPRVRFLFTCSQKPLATVLSRCMPFELGSLTEAELVDVYRSQGYGDARARRAAAFARGSVARGYEVESADTHRIQVLALLRSIVVGDKEQFTAVFNHWDARSSELLNTFFVECLTRRWNTFSEADAGGIEVDRKRLWHMVAALVRVRSARPRLGVRAALEPFLARR